MGVLPLNWFVIAIALPLVTGFSFYQAQLPNGANVPDPCQRGGQWAAVGHQNIYGGGPRNPFGEDFDRAGRNWTRELCQADSDGDGRTNGQELGDPNCMWSFGRGNPMTESITHPGVCEPLESTRCLGKNNFDSCLIPKSSIDNCSVANSSDFKVMDMTFPRATIPPSSKTSLCMTVDASSDMDYQLFALQPLVDLTNVTYSMLLYGCDNSTTTDANMEPKNCTMSSPGCQVIATWTFGEPGKCFGEAIGYRLGKTGFQKLKLEIHYSNTRPVSGVSSSSGLRLYAKLVSDNFQELVIVRTGQSLLEIPPGRPRVTQVGVCNGACTRSKLSKPAYISHTWNSMRSLGVAMTTELFRNGTKVAYLSNDVSYNFSSPVTHYQRPHIEILPGDEVVTTCVYDSRSSNRWVNQGMRSLDEMCVGYLAVYPLDAVVSQDWISLGNLSSLDLISGTPLNGCDWKAFTDFTNMDTIKLQADLTKNCNLNGFCRPECQELTNTLNSHPCLNGEAARIIHHFLALSRAGLDFLGRLHSCPKTSSMTCTTDCPGTSCDGDCSEVCEVKVIDYNHENLDNTTTTGKPDSDGVDGASGLVSDVWTLRVVLTGVLTMQLPIRFYMF